MIRSDLTSPARAKASKGSVMSASPAGAAIMIDGYRMCLRMVRVVRGEMRMSGDDKANGKILQLRNTLKDLVLWSVRDTSQLWLAERGPAGKLGTFKFV